jgi:hypothetical protein
MLRKFVILIVTLVHINGSMFLPQVTEVDVYNAQGQQEDDINTVIEYIDELISDNHRSNPVDEDNDQGQNFHLVKIVDYYFENDFSSLKHKPVTAAAKNKFSILPEEKIFPVTLEIPAPPPKA